MFCKKCGHERAENEKFCPMCGIPFPQVEENTPVVTTEVVEDKKPSEPKVQFCKKCGTKQEESMKFCSVCGKPYLDENGKPYPRGMKKDILDAKEKLSHKVNDISQKAKESVNQLNDKLTDMAQEGKKQFEEKVQPQLNSTMENIKNMDWEGKTEESKKMANSFLNDHEKTGRWAKIITIAIAAFFFIFKAGFGASWFWLILLVALLFLAFKKVDTNGTSKVNSKNVFIATAVLGLFVLVAGPNSEESYVSKSYDSSYSDSDEGNNSSSSGNSGYQAEVDAIKAQIESKSAELERYTGAYMKALSESDGNVMVAQRMYPDICSSFRDKVNEYESLCNKAANVCEKNGDREQGRYFRQLANQTENSINQLEGRY